MPNSRPCERENRIGGTPMESPEEASPDSLGWKFEWLSPSLENTNTISVGIEIGAVAVAESSSEGRP